MVKTGENFCCSSYLREIDEALDRLELTINKFVNSSENSITKQKYKEEIKNIILEKEVLNDRLDLEQKEKDEMVDICKEATIRLKKVTSKVQFIIKNNYDIGEEE